MAEARAASRWTYRRVERRGSPPGRASGAAARAAMRVIAGRWGGRRLRVPSAGVRPTADRVREALFASLGDLAGARVLDLFAGSGALGIEALSRGAAAAVFVERSAAAAAVVRANLEALGAGEAARVLRGEAAAV